ncbi:MAG: alpha-amylase family glycosyl hydrolase, partial [Fibrobacter sp.]|nr:alpha-amylase family glycosyl hydrolase [Fibrobacter sp.]
YYAIDPAYGTMADFEEFLAECEKRDIHVIMDLVLNHTGSEHPWFREAYQYMQSLPADAEPDYVECPYADYYFFDKSPSAAYYYEVEGSDWKYEGKFWSGMPDLNLANLALREEIRNIMDFWLSKGVAGFRLDAAKEFYSDDTPKNVEVLSFLTDTLMELKPGAFLVAEVWEGYSTIADYYESGIPSIFDFYFGDTSGKIVTALRNAGQADKIPYFAQNLQKADEAYLASNPEYIDAPFLSNHDTGRIYGFCGGDLAKMKLAGAMNLFMGGSTFVYYGEELGMPGSGNDPSKRAPMVWNEARDNGVTDPPPECELPESYRFGSLEAQENDDTSIYNYYRQAIAIRQALPVISHGRTTAEEALNVGCISAQRKTWGEETCIILMNIQNDTEAVDLSAYGDFSLAAALSVGGEEITMEGTTLILPAFGVAVLKK